MAVRYNGGVGEQGQAKSDRLKYLLQQTEIFTHFIKGGGGVKGGTCVVGLLAWIMWKQQFRLTDLTQNDAGRPRREARSVAGSQNRKRTRRYCMTNLNRTRKRT
jgi:hypothetical protein